MNKKAKKIKNKIKIEISQLFPDMTTTICV